MRYTCEDCIHYVEDEGWCGMLYEYLETIKVCEEFDTGEDYG